MTLGSLFDGISGFPLAGERVGVKALWASEIESFPMEVSAIRFPEMKQMGDITKLNGAGLESVDIVTGGSPCQDLSVAGKRAGLAGKRSGLFMEQIRIIREMREHEKQLRGTNINIRPRFMVWENVPGAFSSNKGDDFRAVLEETAKVADETIAIPRPTRGGWSTVGCIMGNSWSIAWRVLDAQYWGVPQRRRRIFLVADFGGQSAAEILFKRKSLSRYIAESREAREGIAGDVEGSTRETTTIDFGRQSDRIRINAKTAVTLNSGCGGMGGKTGLYCIPEILPFNTGQITSPQNGNNPKYGDPCHPLCRNEHVPAIIQKVYGICSFESNSMKSDNPHSGIYEAKTSRTLDLNGGSPACNQGGMAIVQCAGFLSRNSEKAHSVGYEENKVPTLRSGMIPDVCTCSNNFKNITESIEYQEDKTALEANAPGNVISFQHSDICGTVSAKWAKGTGGPAGDECYNLVVDKAVLPLSAQPQMRHRLDMDNVVCSVDCRNLYENDEKSGTLQSKTSGGQSLNFQNPVRVGYKVRRLTPLECERLQDFPDGWTDITWQKINKNGKIQILRAKDGPRYKALGNSLAVVCAEYVLEGIKEILNQEVIS